MNTTHRIDAHVELGIQQPFEIVSCHVEEGISETTRALIEVASRDDLNLERVLTGDAEVAILSDGVVERRWSLKVGGARFLTAKNNALRFEVELFSPEWIMTFVKDTRKFRKQSAKDIVCSVLTRSGIKFDWRAARETPRRNYCVQYRELNYDFVRRLLEFEGIYYTFDENGTMILADRSSASPEIPGASHFELLESAGALSHGEEGIHEIRRGARVRPGKATVNDFDWKKPSTNLLKEHAADRDTHLEIYEYPAGYRNPGDGAYLAQVRMESRRVEARYFIGKSSVPRFAPARLFSFGSAVGDAFAGEYLLTRLVHRYRNPGYEAAEAEGARGGHVYENDFTSIPRDVPFRAAIVTERPNVDGYHTAMVRGPIGEEIHTDKHARFRAQFHWDREAKGTDEDSRWLRVVQESASSTFLARVGWEMNVAYIDGDPDRPIGLARNINRVMPPAYGQPGKKTVMTIKTPTSPATGGFNEIRLDDIAGAQEFYVRAERDFVGNVRNDRTETIGNNETRDISKLLSENVFRDQTVKIGSDSKTETGGMCELQVGRHRKDSVGGDESIKVDGGHGLEVKGNETEKVGSSRVTNAESNITRSGKEKMTRVIGGSLTAKAGGNIGTNAGFEFTEEVSGSKTTVSLEGSIQQSVLGPLTVNVTGGVIRSSKSDMSYSSQTSFVTVAATADFKSDEKLKIQTNGTIEIVASEEMKLSVGGVSITLTPGKVGFTGDLTFKTQGKITVTGSPDNITR